MGVTPTLYIFCYPRLNTFKSPFLFCSLVFCREIASFWGFLGFGGLVVGLEDENNTPSRSLFSAIFSPLKTTC